MSYYVGHNVKDAGDKLFWTLHKRLSVQIFGMIAVDVEVFVTEFYASGNVSNKLWKQSGNNCVSYVWNRYVTNEPQLEKTYLPSMCYQLKFKSVCASAQSDQTLRCSYVHLWLSETSQGAHVRRYVFIGGTQMEICIRVNTIRVNHIWIIKLQIYSRWEQRCSLVSSMVEVITDKPMLYQRKGIKAVQWTVVQRLGNIVPKEIAVKMKLLC